jgi:hypothetical protein
MMAPKSLQRAEIEEVRMERGAYTGCVPAHGKSPTFLLSVGH